MNALNRPTDNERLFLLTGTDRHGDSHMISTTDCDRALQHYRIMTITMDRIEGNWAFDEYIRPRAA